MIEFGFLVVLMWSISLCRSGSCVVSRRTRGSFCIYEYCVRSSVSVLSATMIFFYGPGAFLF